MNKNKTMDDLRSRPWMYRGYCRLCRYGARKKSGRYSLYHFPTLGTSVPKAFDQNSEHYKGIYAFSLDTKKMQPEPIYKIDMADKNLFPQPEGITFSPNGTLYISSEGKKDAKATISQMKLTP